MGLCALTFRGAFEDDVEFLHVVIDERDLVVAHHELHHIRLYPPFWAAHGAWPVVRVGLGFVCFDERVLPATSGLETCQSSRRLNVFGISKKNGRVLRLVAT